MSETTSLRNLFTRRDAFIAILVGVLSLGLYVRTLIPWVLPDDSGEFQVLAYQVGIAHTTGYSIYMLLARLFILLVPVGDVAYRVNLFSAAMGALTVSGIYLAGRVLSNNRWGALLGALALTVSFTFWSQALIAEVYTPAAAFQAAVWVALLVWHRTGQKWALFLAGLCGGVGLGVHTNLALLAAAVGIFLLLHKDRWRELWKPALSGALIGLSLFLLGYMIVDFNAPPANIFNASYGPARSAWALTENDINNPLIRFWFIVSARQWRGAMFVDPLKDTPEHFIEYASDILREFSLLTLGLALLGWVMLLRREKRLAVLFGAALLFYWGHSFNYRVGDQYVFHIPDYLLIALLAAAGLGNISRWLEKLKWPGARLWQPVLMLAVIGGGLLPVFSPRLEAVKKGRAPFINAEEYLVDDLAELVYKAAARVVPLLDKDAIVFVDWYNLYPYYYAAHIAQQRTDLRFVEMYTHTDTPGLPDSVIEFIRSEIDTHPIYLADRVTALEKAGFKLQPVYFGFLRFYKVQSSPLPR